MRKVDSSNIHSVDFNSKDNILTVKFHNGAWYEYLKVSNTEYQELIKAKSVGRYFNQHIRDVKDFKILKPKNS